jgi:hypothetical protein
LQSKGLEDARSLRQRFPFRKEEKYFFRAPSTQRRMVVPQATGQKV